MDERVKRIAELAGYSYQDTYDLIYPEWDYPEGHIEWYERERDLRESDLLISILEKQQQQIDELKQILSEITESIWSQK